MAARGSPGVPDKLSVLSQKSEVSRRFSQIDTDQKAENIKTSPFRSVFNCVNLWLSSALRLRALSLLL